MEKIERERGRDMERARAIERRGGPSGGRRRRARSCEALGRDGAGSLNGGEVRERALGGSRRDRSAHARARARERERERERER